MTDEAREHIEEALRHLDAAQDAQPDHRKVIEEIHEQLWGLLQQDSD